MKLRAVMVVLLACGLAATVTAYNGQTGPDRKELLGSPWYSREPAGPGEPFTFYYFNPDGDGIFRFGRVGKVLTERFTWRVSGGQLFLEFRNTGERARTAYRVEPFPEKPGHVKLILIADPREEGRRMEYSRKAPKRLEASDSPGTLVPPEHFR